MYGHAFKGWRVRVWGEECIYFAGEGEVRRVKCFMNNLKDHYLVAVVSRACRVMVRGNEWGRRPQCKPLLCGEPGS